MKKRIVSILTALSLMASVSTVMAQGENNVVYQMEQLDRGLVVLNNSGNMYMSWRLLGTESYDTKFYVYRDGVPIATVSDSTNYTDKSGSMTSIYQIAPVNDTNAICDGVTAWTSGSNYVDLNIPSPPGGTMNVNNGTEDYTYAINDISTGDLDGDGQYELVVKFMPSNAGEAGTGYTASVMLGAYELDGTPLWKDSLGNTKYIDLGMNVRANPHGTQFLVYDFDGDGIAEISTKTAQGTIDTSGQMLVEDDTTLNSYIKYEQDNHYYVVDSSQYSSDDLTDRVNSKLTHVNTSGGVLCGREYYTAFDGQTGAFIDSAAYHGPRTFTYYNSYTGAYESQGTKELGYLWGDTWGNRGERYIATVSYIEGSGTPFMVEWRGYYHGKNSKDGNYGGFGRTAVGAYKLDKSGNLTCDYVFDTVSEIKEKYDNGNLSWNDIFGSSSNATNVLKTNNPLWVYCGNGNHNITNADVDDDGMDEVISGSLCLQVKDGKLTPKWNYGKDHGDALHIGRYVKGGKLVYFTVHEASPYGMTLIDPYNDGSENPDGSVGEPDVIYHSDAGGDTGRGIMAKTDANGFMIDSSGNDSVRLIYDPDGTITSANNEKYEGRSNDDQYAILGAGTRMAVTPAPSATPDIDNPVEETPEPDVTDEPAESTTAPTEYTGTRNAFNYPVGGKPSGSWNFRIFWDGDLYDELFDGRSNGSGFVLDYDSQKESCGKMTTFSGTVTNNSSKANACLIADLFGDWREEVVCRLADNSGVRIYTTNIPTTNKLYTLMHDPTYRCGVAAEQSAYNQPPHVGYYIGEDMDTYQWQSINAPTAPNFGKTEYTYNWGVVEPGTAVGGNIVLSENFDSDTGSLKYWNESSDTAESAVVYENGMAKISFPAGASDVWAGYVLPESVSDTYTMAMDFQVSSNGSLSLQHRDSSNDSLIADKYAYMNTNFSFSNGTLKYYSSSTGSGTSIAKLDETQWYTFKLSCDFSTRKIEVSVFERDSGSLAGSYSGSIRQSDAKNLKRIAFFQKDVIPAGGMWLNLDNVKIWTYDAPTEAVIAPEDILYDMVGKVTESTVLSNQTVSFSAKAYYNENGAELTDYNENLSWGVYQGDTLETAVPATTGFAFDNFGNLKISREAAAGKYFVIAKGETCTGISILNVEENLQLVTDDIVLQVTSSKASLPDKIYQSKEDMDKGENPLTAVELGITADTDLLTILATFSNDIKGSVHDYKITRYEIELLKDNIPLGTVNPQLLDNKYAISQFFGDLITPGDYHATVKIYYTVGGSTEEHSVSVDSTAKIQEAIKQLKEYYYNDGNRNISILIYGK